MTKAWERRFDATNLALGSMGHDVSCWPPFLLHYKALSLGQMVGMQLLSRLEFTISHQGPKYMEILQNG